MVLSECGHVPHEEKPVEFLTTVLGQLVGQEGVAGGTGEGGTAGAGSTTTEQAT